MLDSFMLRSNYAEMATAVHSTCATVTTIFLFSRLWVRKTQCKGLWWDDYLLIASWVLLLAGNGSNAAAPSYGFNLLVGTPRGWQLVLASVTLFYLAGALARTAFALTLLRIAPPGPLRAGLRAIACAVWLFAGAGAIVTWLRICDVTKGVGFQGRCADVRVVLWVHIGNCVYTVVSDVVLAVMPWCLLGGISIPDGEKLGVGVSMSLVGISAVLCIVRATFGGYATNLEKRHERPDWTYGLMAAYCLLQAEVAIFIVAQAIPLLRVLCLGDARSSIGREAVSLSEVVSVREAGKGKSPATAQDMFVDNETELVRLPTGRIVAADSEEGKAFKVSEQSGEAAPFDADAAERADAAPGGQEPAPGREAHQSRVTIDDEVHELWADMGLSRKAWSQSPSPTRPSRRETRASRAADA